MFIQRQCRICHLLGGLRRERDIRDVPWDCGCSGVRYTVDQERWDLLCREPPCRPFQISAEMFRTKDCPDPGHPILEPGRAVHMSRLCTRLGQPEGNPHQHRASIGVPDADGYDRDPRRYPDIYDRCNRPNKIWREVLLE